jgi:two-component system CheB/CheR fusion protein
MTAPESAIAPSAESLPESRPSYFVGVGASAGGLEALERLFERMPPETGAAFIVVQHLSPDFRSLTDELLARRTRIPIHRVENGMEVRRDAIYLIPPKKDMIIANGRLLLTDKDPAQFLALPIDHFFRSLAQDARDRAIGIVLSGTGSDGSRGIRDIHEAGGMVIAQAAETAKFDGMPRSAIETGVVDRVLAPEEMPDALMRYTRHPGAPAPSSAAETPAPAGMDVVFRLLRETYQIDFSQYKSETVARRTERRLVLNHSFGLDDYINRLANDPEELNQLYKDLLIGVTRFFRDEEAFHRLARDVIPGILNRLPKGEEARVWVAGCATGEEAYSLAILLIECSEALQRPVAVKIFATDVHKASLDFASAGQYSESSLAGVSPARLERYFVRKGEGYQVSPELRKLVVFAPHNILRDAPFTKIDLVSCRNLLIYFQPPAQKKVFSLFHFGLKTGGVLFLGPSESPGELADEFDTTDSRWKIYSKRRDIRLPPDVRLPLTVSPFRPRPAVAGPAYAATPDQLLLGAYDALLDEYMPPALLVSEAREVLQTFAGASKYLKLRDGRFSADLLDMVDQELRTALAGALPRALIEMTPVVYKGLRVRLPEGERVVDVTVKPVQSRRANVPYALVQLDEIGVAPTPQVQAHQIDPGQASRDQILSLEADLRHTKENLQAMVEEMETSNEELQASNEELVASNEELQSTNEELHSVNEELYTVNAEHQRKIAELTELTADMENLLACTEVHTIFLDRSLRIRKFTPKVAETFNLLAHDVGRRIDSFTHTLDHPGLLDDLRAVLRTGTPCERQVRGRQGAWFLMRVFPYRSGSAVDGVVFTLVDIGRVKQAEADLLRLGQQLGGILRHSPAWLFVKDLDGRYLVCGDSFKKTVGTDPTGKTARDIFPADVAEAVAAREARVTADGADTRAEVVLPGPDGPHTYLAVEFPLADETGRVTGVGGVHTDITDLKRAEKQARDAVVQRDRFLAMLSHELRNPLAALLNSVRVIQHYGSRSEQAAEWFPVIERRSRHMARLLDDLLDISRLTQNKFEIRRQPFDVVSSAPGVLEEVRPIVDERRLQVSVDLSEEPLCVEGDPARIHQAQVNLLMNAAKYTPEGGRVRYSIRREGDEAVIRVRDSGVGLSREMLDKAFDLFVQADETLDRSGGGMGVGLTLVRWIVDLHGGRVRAYSDGPGTGSEFVIWLPLEAKAPGPAPGPPAPGADGEAARGKKVLVVEDDADIRASLQTLLEMSEFRVRTAVDGPGALDALNRECPDLALIDIGLPGMSGYELCRQIGQRLPARRPYLIALTGYGQAGDRQAALAAGFDAHVTKPFNPADLLRVLESAPPARR